MSTAAPVISTEVKSPVPAEVKSEQPVQVPAEVKSEQPVQVPAEVKSEQPVQVPAEVKSEQPVQTTVEVKSEQPVQVPAEVKSEQSTQTTVEVKSEQPVQVPVEVKSEQPVQVPAEVKLSVRDDIGSIRAGVHKIYMENCVGQLLKKRLEQEARITAANVKSALEKYTNVPEYLLTCLDLLKSTNSKVIASGIVTAVNEKKWALVEDLIYTGCLNGEDSESLKAILNEFVQYTWM
jgi:hypothetical protein